MFFSLIAVVLFMDGGGNVGRKTRRWQPVEIDAAYHGICCDDIISRYKANRTMIWFRYNDLSDNDKLFKRLH